MKVLADFFEPVAMFAVSLHFVQDRDLVTRQERRQINLEERSFGRT